MNHIITNRFEKVDGYPRLVKEFQRLDRCDSDSKVSEVDVGAKYIFGFYVFREDKIRKK